MSETCVEHFLRAIGVLAALLLWGASLCRLFEISSGA